MNSEKDTSRERRSVMAFARHRNWALIAVGIGATLVSGCSARSPEESAPAPDSGAVVTEGDLPTGADAGVDSGLAVDASADSGPDSGSVVLEPPAAPAWPEPSRIWPGAQGPSIAILPSGVVAVSYVLEGAAWVQLEPELSDMPQHVVDNMGSGKNLRLAASPEEEVLVALDANAGVHVIRDGFIEAVFRPLGYPSVTAYNLAWTATRPVALIESNFNNAEYWLHAIAIPDASASVEVSQTTLLNSRSFRYQMYSEAPSLLPLDGAGPTLRALVFPSAAVAGPSGYGTLAAWVRVSGDLDAGGYLANQASGNFELPIPSDQNASWISAHDLGAGVAVLTWHQIPVCACQVYDVMLARLSVDVEGTPSVVGEAVNVSQTPGQTDESDGPVVVPRGDGSFYIAWRETSFGPRVALYDANLSRQWIVAPDQDDACAADEPISAAVDAQGRLHLVATLRPEGSPEVRYWIFE